MYLWIGHPSVISKSISTYNCRNRTRLDGKERAVNKNRQEKLGRIIYKTAFLLFLTAQPYPFPVTSN